MNAPFPFRAPAAVRTLLDTAHGYDAHLCGFDGPTPVEEGGYRVVYDERGDIPSVEITIPDGQVCGAGAIEALANALLQAESLASRKEVSLSQDSLIRMGVGGE